VFNVSVAPLVTDSTWNGSEVHVACDVALPCAVAQSSTMFHVPATSPPQGDTLPQFVPLPPVLGLLHAQRAIAPHANVQLTTCIGFPMAGRVARSGAGRHKDRPFRAAGYRPSDVRPRT
jgi:hypothetical protein